MARKFDAKERAEVCAKYDVAKVLRSLAAAGKAGGGNAAEDIGYEREISAEVDGLRGNRTATHGGIFLPDFLMRTAGEETLGRPSTGTLAGIGGAGSNTVATDLLADEYIDPLAAKTMLLQAGARFIGGLVGNIAIPRGGNVEASWIGEGADATKKNPTYGQVTGTPHTCAAYTDVTHQLMAQTSLPLQKLIIDLLNAALGRALERAAYDGTGQDAQPLGLLRTSGIHAIDGITAGAPTKQNLIDFWSAIESAEATGDAMKWIGTSKVKGKLAGTLDVNLIKNVAGTENVGGVTAAKYLLEGGKMEDYDFIMSNLMPAGKLIFGDWAQLCVATWEGVELVVDPFTLSTSGGLRVVAFKDADILVRQPAAFAHGTILAQQAAE